MNVVITGSIAYDYLMSFPGVFTEHLLAEHLHRVSVSFLVDAMDKRRGGCAPNIAYTLALLGERPQLMGTAGRDFDEYRNWLEAAGVETSLVHQIPDTFTASFFCSTDRVQNQIASFYAGAMAYAANLSIGAVGACDLIVISPNDPAAMLKYARECRALGIPYIFDPGQQCARMSGDELAEGLHGAALLMCNDYEFELLGNKTRLTEAEILANAAAIVVTRGEGGSAVVTRDASLDVPAVAPREVVDPTGVGDAFRGGFIKGLAMGVPYGRCAELGAVAATYALEHLGGQGHTFALDEFAARHAAAFGSGLVARALNDGAKLPADDRPRTTVATGLFQEGSPQRRARRPVLEGNLKP